MLRSSASSRRALPPTLRRRPASAAAAAWGAVLALAFGPTAAGAFLLRSGGGGVAEPLPADDASQQKKQLPTAAAAAAEGIAAPAGPPPPRVVAARRPRGEEERVGLLCREYGDNVTDLDVFISGRGVRDLVFYSRGASASVSDRSTSPRYALDANGTRQTRVRCREKSPGANLSGSGARCSPVALTAADRPVPKCSLLATEKKSNAEGTDADRGAACGCEADMEEPPETLYQQMMLKDLLATCLAAQEEGRPFRVLAVGLGGGAMPMYLRRHCAAASVESVEVDPRVVVIAENLLGFRPDSRNSVECADGLQAVRLREAAAAGSPTAPRYDFAIVDCLEGDGTVPSSCRLGPFVGGIHAVLAPRGRVLQLVLRGDADKLMRLYSSFFGRANVTSVGDGQFLVGASRGA